MRVTLHLVNPQQAAVQLQGLYPEMKSWLLAGHALELEVRPERRSTEANAKMWVLLGHVSRQVVWHGQKLAAEEWKDVFTSALKRLRVVPGLDGGFVVLGGHTSRMSNAEIGELIDLIYAFGAQNDVNFEEPKE